MLLSDHSVTSTNAIHCGDSLAVLRAMPSDFVHCIVTSPPYFGLRNYNDTPGQLGMERTPEDFVSRLVIILREARRVLRDDGTLWLNLGDSYSADVGGKCDLSRGAGINQAVTGFGYHVQSNRNGSTGLPPKSLIGIPWRVAFALQADGWTLRSDIIWHKPAPMPESVRDRPTKAHEYLFLLSKSERYFYDSEAIAEPAIYGARGSRFDTGKTAAAAGQLAPVGTGPRLENGSRNRRSVWTIPTEPSPIPHYAMFPQGLIEPCILAGSPRQCCAVCGTPYERLIERAPMELSRSNRRLRLRDYGRTSAGGHMIKPPAVQTLGFAPSCDCGAPDRPGLVLDPFMGAGTTALVCQRLGRDYIGIDIDRSSVELARERIRYAGDDRRLMREQTAGVRQLSMI